MMPNVIYEKHFPKDPVLEELSKRQYADEFNEQQVKYPSFSEMIADLERRTTYTPRPYRIRHRNRFIQAAIVVHYPKYRYDFRHLLLRPLRRYA